MNDDMRTRLRSLQGKNGNDRCAECEKPNPQWASVNLGIFICIECSGIHRRLSTSITGRVYSVELDRWSDDVVQLMEKGGNHQSIEKWAAKVPSCWIRPNPNSPYVCREQWIRAKYERKEFTADTNNDQPYISGSMEGYLFKKKKQSDEYKKRFFVLQNQSLKYYVNDSDKAPKSVLAIAGVNVTLDVPGMENRPNAMLINCRNERGIVRSIFVYADNGKVIMEWYCAIRSSKMLALKLQNPTLRKDELATLASSDFTLHGQLCKMPPRQNKFQNRFFVLDRNSLRYYYDKKDALPQGEIILRREDRVDENVPTHLKQYGNTLMLHTSSRARGGFPLLAQTAEQKTEWMVAIRLTIDKMEDFPRQYTLRPSYTEDDSDSLSCSGYGDSPPPTPRTLTFENIESFKWGARK